MQIINGLNYYSKLERMIEECYQKAKDNPFESFIFIAENPSVVEQLFFKHTHYLVNIEIVSWQRFLQQLLIEQHLTRHHVLSQTELTYHLRHILNHYEFHCFHNRQPYPLIKEFIPLLQDYDLNQTYQQDQSPDRLKLKDFLKLYLLLKEQCDSYTHISYESIFDQSTLQSQISQHIYIEADHLYQAKRQDIIQRLSKYHDITLLYTHTQDKRILNMPYHNLCQEATSFNEDNYLTEHLFIKTPKLPLDTDCLYTFISATPHQEVKRVVYTIYQKIVDEGLQYKDFMIVYPDQSYVNPLIDTLSALNIPHNLPIITSCQYDYSYQMILNHLDEDYESTIKDIAHTLDQLDIENEYHQYLQSLFDYTDTISSSEFKEFFMMTYTSNHQDICKNQDHISICSIDQVQSSQSIHIYILGMNETILPRRIKDTSLLLDEDIEILRQHHISTPLSTLEQLGVHHNDILKALMQPCLSMTFSYSKQTLSGGTLLGSSLYKELQQLFILKPLPMNQYVSIEDYYLRGGLDQDKDILNKHIQSYLQCKNQPEHLSLQTSQQLYSQYLSVSQIETYNKCPFLYFMQYGLGIYPPKEDQLLPNELGSLVHYVLSMNIDQDLDIKQLVHHYIEQDEHLSKKISLSQVNQYFIDQMIKDLNMTLIVLKEHLNISHFEIQDKEKKIESQIQTMNFKGYIDRIDQYKNYISIIDYKSSAKDIDLNLAMQGFNIQMLLYLKMVTETYHKDPGAVLYFNTKKRILASTKPMSEPIDKQEFYKLYRYGGYIIDDENHDVIHALDPYLDKRSDIINVSYVKTKETYKGHLLTPSQLDILLETIETHIYELYTQILSGNIDIAPKGSDNRSTHMLVNPCRYCPYHSVCSFDVFYNDYQMVEFLDVEKILGGEDNAI